MKRLCYPLLLCAGTALAEPAPPVAAQPLGRLFLKPEQRTHLERLRQFDLREEQQIPADRYTVHGVVTRSTGATTLWLNERRLYADRPEKIGVPPPYADRARLSTEPGREFELRVGETLEAASGEIRGGLQGGQVGRSTVR